MELPSPSVSDFAPGGSAGTAGVGQGRAYPGDCTAHGGHYRLLRVPAGGRANPHHRAATRMCTSGPASKPPPLTHPFLTFALALSRRLAVFVASWTTDLFTMAVSTPAPYLCLSAPSSQRRKSNQLAGVFRDAVPQEEGSLQYGWCVYFARGGGMKGRAHGGLPFFRILRPGPHCAAMKEKRGLLTPSACSFRAPCYPPSIFALSRKRPKPM